MRLGWLTSFFVHCALLGAGYISLSHTRPLDDQGVYIPVTVTSVDELTNIRASVKPPQTKPKPEPEPLDDLPMTVTEAMDNAPEAADRAQKRATDQITAPVATRDGAGEPALQPQDQTAEFDLDNLANLVNRAKETQREANMQQALISEKNFFEYSDTAREIAGAGTALTMSEQDALRRAMYRCWRVPIDATNPEELIVRVRVKLLRSGQVEQVILLDEGQIAMSRNPFMAIAAQRALSAVSKCAPYDFLPPEKYDSWRDMKLRFKPEI